MQTFRVIAKLPDMRLINHTNYLEAEEAVRDILMMYVDLADHTAGFGHAADIYIRFDPFEFIDAEIEGEGYYYVDLDLCAQVQRSPFCVVSTISGVKGSSS